MLPFASLKLFMVVLIGALSIWLIFLVLWNNRKDRINRHFSLMSFFILLWVFFGYFSRIQPDLSLAILFYRANLASVSMMFIFVYFFSTYFPIEDKRYPLLDKLVLFFNTLLAFIILFTNLIVRGVSTQNKEITFILGDFSFIFYGMVYFLTMLILFMLARKYSTLSEHDKLRVQYFIVGGFMFAIVNLIVNVSLPLLQGNFKYYWIGDYSMIIWIALTAYAIVRRELFGIKVVLTAFLVAVIAILLFAQAVTSESWVEFGWKFGIFLIFVYFGYLLIQSVVREIQRRAELQRLYEEVDRLSRAKSEFISIASHQLRTPLTAVKGYISMLIEGTYGKLTGRTVPPMEKVYASNERLIKLVNDLLNVSRIESGTLRIDLQKTSLEKMISSIVDELSIKANEKKLYLKWEKSAPSTSSGQAPEPLPEVTIDADKFRQVVLNIIDNCIKYTEKGGVAVKTELKKATAKWPQGSVLIEVKDTGEGMTREELEKMFESFTRGQAGEKYWSAGTGLGLYIARKFTEIHGGRVWAESEGEGKGSTFYIELPVK